jgi:hypothetical protein
VTAEGLAGRWHMTWGGSEGEAILHPEGHWACSLNGRTWQGRWTLCNGVLSVEEREADAPPECEPLRWTVDLTRGLSGGLCRGGHVSFRRIGEGR